VKLSNAPYVIQVPNGKRPGSPVGGNVAVISPNALGGALSKWPTNHPEFQNHVVDVPAAAARRARTGLR